MKRVVALALTFLFAVAVTAQAQDFKAPVKSSAPAAVKSASLFSKTSVDKAVAAVVKATPAPPRMTMHKFMRTPWPYVIAAGIVAVLIFSIGGSPIATGPY